MLKNHSISYLVQLLYGEHRIDWDLLIDNYSLDMNS